MFMHHQVGPCVALFLFRYYGARCQSCSAGFFGRPEVQGATCKSCQCSGNINPEDQGSCDSVTGECLRCLNNTFGAACSLCAPGYFGDAITLKDCQTCLCDETGTNKCDSYSGTCQCHPNVIGEKCDSCQVDHFGFTSGEGCKACNCQIASESTQCEDLTGQCKCKRGVTGRTCDHCAPGFWSYTPDGCSSCGCNTEYSLGFGCNAQTGQCECLPGVIGEKCDHCPYRWVLIENQGCFECDSCTHDLLDVTDELKDMLDPFMEEFENVASGYFTTRRLVYINQTLQELAPEVDLLDPKTGDVLNPIVQELETIEQNSKNLNRKSSYSLENSENIKPQTMELQTGADDILEAIRKTALQANETVSEVDDLSFDNGEGPKIDQALHEANIILDDIKTYNYTPNSEEAADQLIKALDLLDAIDEFIDPVEAQEKELSDMKKIIDNIKEKIKDIANYTTYTLNNIAQVEELNMKYRGDIVLDKIHTIQTQSDSAIKDLEAAHELITNATQGLADAHRTTNKLMDDPIDLESMIDSYSNITYEDERQLDPLEDALAKAHDHAEELSYEAQKFDHQLTDTRNISENALDAANAYKKIVNATQEAKNASEQALKAAEETNKLLDGLEDKSSEAENASFTLLQEAQSLYEAKNQMQPALEENAQLLEEIKSKTDQSDSDLTKIEHSLTRLGDKNYEEPSEHAVYISDIGKKKSKDAVERIAEIAENTKNDKEHAKKLPKDIDDTIRDVNTAHTQLDKVNTILPNITNLIDELGPQQAALHDNIDDIEKKIKILKEKIKGAQETANR